MKITKNLETSKISKNLENNQNIEKSQFSNILDFSFFLQFLKKQSILEKLFSLWGGERFLCFLHFDFNFDLFSFFSKNQDKIYFFWILIFLDFQDFRDFLWFSRFLQIFVFFRSSTIFEIIRYFQDFSILSLCIYKCRI